MPPHRRASDRFAHPARNGSASCAHLNSPNELVYRSDGTLYFTDPPFGLPATFDDPRKELPWSGVYRARDGEVTLLTDELTGPNGIAFSPDERYLYVGNWDPHHKVVMRWEVDAAGDITNGIVPGLCVAFDSHAAGVEIEVLPVGVGGGGAGRRPSPERGSNIKWKPGNEAT